MTLGERVREAISMSGFSAEEVAQEIDMSKQNLYKLFKKDSFETRHLQKIADLLSLPLGYFLEPGQRITQTGVGNNTGTVRNQRIGIGEMAKEAAEKQEELARLRFELAQCQAERQGQSLLIKSLEQRVKDKEEMIQLLKERNKK